MSETIRKMATIQQISAINPIPNADAIEVATVKGWQIVVKKNEFRVGDDVVFCEVDSILPDWPEFAFLKDKNDPTKPIRLRTVKLRGQISQGIVFPLEIIMSRGHSGLYEIGQDVTEFMGVVKYEPPILLKNNGEIKGVFPHFIHKTEEERIQNFPFLLDRYRGTPFYVTEKVDGTSATYYWNRGDFGACSRNYDLKEGDTPYWRVAKKYDIFQKMGELHKNIAIQGELMGPSIQKNRYHLKDYDLFVFNAYDIDRQESYSLAELKILCANLGLKMVPILTESYMLPHTMQEILDYANAPSTLYPPMIREGVVIRSIVPMRDIDIGRLSFKVRNNAFLLKYGDD